MKIKWWYFLYLGLITVVFGWITVSQHAVHALKQKYTQTGLLSDIISAQQYSTNLTGNALVLYNATHAKLPNLSVQRLLMHDDVKDFSLSLQGIRGSLMNYFHTTHYHTFKQELAAYNPATDLLKDPLMTLSILGYDSLDLTIMFKATRTAPNQIILNTTVYIGGIKHAHFSTKLLPTKPNASVFENLKAQPLSLSLEFLSEGWKQKLDDYALSKNTSFSTEHMIYEGHFF